MQEPKENSTSNQGEHYRKPLRDRVAQLLGKRSRHDIPHENEQVARFGAFEHKGEPRVASARPLPRRTLRHPELLPKHPDGLTILDIPSSQISGQGRPRRLITIEYSLEGKEGFKADQQGALPPIDLPIEVRSIIVDSDDPHQAVGYGRTVLSKEFHHEGEDTLVTKPGTVLFDVVPPDAVGYFFPKDTTDSPSPVTELPKLEPDQIQTMKLAMDTISRPPEN